MKVRLDFVSNSSSSSFVLELPEPIKDMSFKEFAQLFSTGKSLYNLYEKLKTEDPELNTHYISVGNEGEIPDSHLEGFLQEEFNSNEIILDYENDH